MISVCIPCYEMHNWGAEMLNFSLVMLENQEYKDFEIIISDDSSNNSIRDVCADWCNTLNIRYFKNPNKKGLSSNLNNAISNSKGDIIKVLCQDDFLLDEDSLQITKDSFNYNKGWLVTSYYYGKNGLPYKEWTPKWNNKIYFNNTIGTHSCLSFLNKNPLFFDINLSWYMDCEYYYRLFLQYGEPEISTFPTFFQRIWEGQATTSLITNSIIEKETEYLIEKYG